MARKLPDGIRLRSDGRYEGRAIIEYRDGTKKRKSFYGYSVDDVKEQIRIEKARKRAFEPQNITTRDFLNEVYLPAIKPLDDVEPVRPRVRFSTYSGREKDVRVHLLSTIVRGRQFSAYKLEDLSSGLIRQLFDQLSANGVGGRARQVAYETLRAALNYAVEIEYIEFNPTNRVPKPAHEAKETEIPEETDFATLLQAIERSRHRALFMLASTTAMRQGEILGLRWDTIDLKTGVLRVRKTLTRVKKGPNNLATRAPKTKAGIREIHLVPEALEALKAHRNALRDSGLLCEWVFPTRNKRPMERSNFREDIYHALLRDAGDAFWEPGKTPNSGKPKITFHALRHLVATLLAEEETNPMALKEMLGHEDYRTTANIYAHATRRMRKHASEKMTDVLKRVRGVGSNVGSENAE